MSLRLIESKGDAVQVLLHPDILDTISEDDVETVFTDDAIYLCGFVDNVVIGCFVLHRHSRVTVECHVQVLPEYRPTWAERFGQAVIDWTWKNVTADKLVAQIPIKYPNVKAFAVKMGFEVEGTNKLSYRKNGILMDQWYLGLSKHRG